MDTMGQTTHKREHNKKHPLPKRSAPPFNSAKSGSNMFIYADDADQDLLEKYHNLMGEEGWREFWCAIVKGVLKNLEKDPDFKEWALS